MGFIDGENFTCRGQEYAKEAGITLPAAGKYFDRDKFLWIPDMLPAHMPLRCWGEMFRHSGVRFHYYAGVVGDDPQLTSVREQLWQLGFHPEVLKKKANNRSSKGVDITLTKDMLSHAYKDNYDVAVLITGDADFVPLVEEVKRTGKQVFLAFVGQKGLSDSLKFMCDQYKDLSGDFKSLWEAHLVRLQQATK